MVKEKSCQAKLSRGTYVSKECWDLLDDDYVSPGREPGASVWERTSTTPGTPCVPVAFSHRIMKG